MRHDFTELSQELEVRPINNNEIAELREHASAVRTSASTAQQLKELEFTIIHATIGELYKKYPHKLEEFQGCKEKTLRDMKLVMRYAIYSIVLDDPQYAKDRMYIWFRTILNAFEFGKEFIEDAYRMAQKRCDQYLGQMEAKQVSFMVDEAVEVFNS